MSIDLNKPYNPGIAEIGRFAEIVAPSVSSYGHYAVITIDAGSLPASAGGLGGPLGTQADPIWTNFTTVVSAVDVSLSGVQMSEVISAVNCVVSAQVTNWPDAVTAVEVTNWPTLLEATTISSINLNLSAIVNFSPAINLIELYNNSQNKIYFSYDVSTTFEDLTSKGMILAEDSYYSIEKNISNIVLGSASASDIRIFGHRR
jgi:hypothetical protein